MASDQQQQRSGLNARRTTARSPDHCPLRCKSFLTPTPSVVRSFLSPITIHDDVVITIQPVRRHEDDLWSIRTPGTTLGLHVCKGNGTKSWQAVGGYEEFARDFLQRAPGFDLFQLEFDDDRSGSFQPLQYVPDDKLCVLGLVSTKEKQLEKEEVLRSRIDQAAAFHPLDKLALSTQCGFASGAETAEQRLFEWEAQENKLRLVAETGHAVWTDS